MSGPSGQNLDQCLTDGENSWVVGMSNWLRQQQQGPSEGPWLVRVSTKLDGESWKPLKEGNATISKGYDPANLPLSLAAKIHAAVVERYGPAPLCRLRINAYEEGRSREYEDGFSIERAIQPTPSATLGAGVVDATYHMTMVGQFQTAVIGAMQTLRDVVGSLSTSNAAKDQQIAVLSTTRVVPTASADLGSTALSLLGPVALAMAWPMMRQISNDPRGTAFVADMYTMIRRLVNNEPSPELAGPTPRAIEVDAPPPTPRAPPPDLPPAPDHGLEDEEPPPDPDRDVHAEPASPPGYDIAGIRAWAEANPEGGRQLVVEALERAGAPAYVVDYVRNAPSPP